MSLGLLGGLDARINQSKEVGHKQLLVLGQGKYMYCRYKIPVQVNSVKEEMARMVAEEKSECLQFEQQSGRDEDDDCLVLLGLCHSEQLLESYLRNGLLHSHRLCVEPDIHAETCLVVKYTRTEHIPRVA